MPKGPADMTGGHRQWHYGPQQRSLAPQAAAPLQPASPQPVAGRLRDAPPAGNHAPRQWPSGMEAAPGSGAIVPSMGPKFMAPDTSVVPPVFHFGQEAQELVVESPSQVLLPLPHARSWVDPAVNALLFVTSQWVTRQVVIPTFNLHMALYAILHCSDLYDAGLVQHWEWRTWPALERECPIPPQLPVQSE